ncbi:MAG: peptidoglycan DD-metalloendopeptidase family protein [Deltaproteobacteria bacterium]
MKKDNPAEIRRAVKEFESLFISQMLKEMRSTVMQSELMHSSNSEDIYTSMLDTELSKVMANSGGIGLGDMLLRQLSVGAESGKGASVGTQMQGYRPAVEHGVHAPHADETPHHNHGLEPEAVEGGIRPPVKGVLSSAYGLRKDPITGDDKFHHGMDIAAAEGSPIYPAAPGRVVFSGLRPGYGNVVEVLHADGTITRYAHNQKNLVSQGDSVTKSKPIAYVGSTGRSTGPHLHFEVLKDGSSVDPERYLYG